MNSFATRSAIGHCQNYCCGNVCDHTHPLQISSKSLYQVVEKDLSNHYIKDNGVIKLIQAFLCPEHLIKIPEYPDSLREDTRVVPVDDREKFDPLYNLFRPPSRTKLGKRK